MRKAWLRLALVVGLGLPVVAPLLDGLQAGSARAAEAEAPGAGAAAERAAPTPVPVLGPWGIVALIAAMATGPALVLGTRRPPPGRGGADSREED